MMPSPWRSRSRTQRIEDDARMYGRRLTAEQKNERQDNGDKKRLARQHPSDLLSSLTRERDRRRTARHCFDSDWTSPFRPIELSTCSTLGTWCACVYLVITLIPCLLVLFSLDVLHTLWYRLVWKNLILNFVKTGLKSKFWVNPQFFLTSWSSHRLQHFHHSCIIFITDHTLCDLDWSGIGSCNRVFEKRNNAGNNAKWIRLHLSGDLTKNFNLYSYIAMKVFPGNHLPSLAIICHRSVVSTIGVTARSNDRVHFLQSISASMIF